MLSAAATRLSLCDVFDVMSDDDRGASGQRHPPRLPRRHHDPPPRRFRRLARPACVNREATPTSRRTEGDSRASRTVGNADR